MAQPQRSYLGLLPTSAVKPFRGAKDTLALMTTMALGDRGERSMKVHHFAQWVTRDVWPKDYLGEIISLRNAFVQLSPWRPGVPLIRYVNDPRHVEVVKDPERMVDEILESGTTQADCDEIALLAGTLGLHLGREVEWVALGFEPDSLSHVGTRIKEPKSDRWIWVDGVAGPKEISAAQRAKQILIWSLD